MSSGISKGVSNFLTNKLPDLDSTPVLKEGVKSAITGALGEGVGAFAGSIVVSESFEQANHEMLSAAAWGAISGFTTGFMTEGIKQLSLGTPNKQKSKNSIETQINNQLNSTRNTYYRNNEYIQINIDYRMDMDFNPSFSTDYYDYYTTPIVIPNEVRIINPENNY